MSDIQQEAPDTPEAVAVEPAQAQPTVIPPGEAAVAKPEIPSVDLTIKLSELENSIRERDVEITKLRSDLTEAFKERDKEIEIRFSAVRADMLKAHQDIPEELLTGQNVEELQASLVKASALVAKIKAQTPVVVGPAGAPVRSGPDWSTMSSREKIVHGLSSR